MKCNKIRFETIDDGTNVITVYVENAHGQEVLRQQVGVENNVFQAIKEVSDFSNVMRSLQEKKKVWEGRQSKWMDEEKSLTDDTDFDDERLILIENINLSEQIINDLEDIINQNFA